MTLTEVARQLLEDVDVLQQDYKEGKALVSNTKSLLHMEEVRRVSAEQHISSLDKELKRLQNWKSDFLASAEHQYSYASKNQELMAQLELKDGQLKDVLKAHAMNMCNFTERAQAEKAHMNEKIRTTEKGLAEEKQQRLLAEQEMASLKRANESLKQKFDAAEATLMAKENSEISLLRAKLHMEELEKQTAQEALQREKRHAQEAKEKLEEHMQELNKNRHAEMFKQKLMRLRKENEDLKRRLQAL